jgi:hypothetical protein
MSIFGVIKSDDQVFANDKIRIDASESFLAPGLSFHATVSHEISVDAGVTWYNISSSKKVDWIFSTTGAKTISLRLTTTAPSTQTFTKSITVLNQTTQGMFSKDSDLYKFEPEIDQYLPKKWSSWNLIHLQAQEWIMDWLDESRLYNIIGLKYTVADIMDIQQVKQLSCYKVLEFIFEGNSNVVGDISSMKRDKYRSLALTKMSRGALNLDFNDDGIAGATERHDLFTGGLTRK